MVDILVYCLWIGLILVIMAVLYEQYLGKKLVDVIDQFWEINSKHIDRKIDALRPKNKCEFIMDKGTEARVLNTNLGPVYVALKIRDGCKLTFEILNPLAINIGLNNVIIMHGPNLSTFLVGKALGSFEEILAAWDKTKYRLDLNTKLVLKSGKITKLEVTLEDVCSLSEYISLEIPAVTITLKSAITIKFKPTENNNVHN
jgi:hypothetical protein